MNYTTATVMIVGMILAATVILTLMYYMAHEDDGQVLEPPSRPSGFYERDEDAGWQAYYRAYEVYTQNFGRVINESKNTKTINSEQQSITSR